MTDPDEAQAALRRQKDISIGRLPVITGGMTDPLDHALLDILRRNARTPTAALARRLGISRTTLQGRIERLERQGQIRGYTLVESPDEDPVRAHVSIVITPRHSQKVERDLKSLPELRELHSVSGASDLIALLGAPNTESINRAIDDIGLLEGVERTVSAILLSTRYRRSG